MDTSNAPRWVKVAHRLAWEGATPGQIAKVLGRDRRQVDRVLGSGGVTLDSYKTKGRGQTDAS